MAGGVAAGKQASVEHGAAAGGRWEEGAEDSGPRGAWPRARPGGAPASERRMEAAAGPPQGPVGWGPAADSSPGAGRARGDVTRWAALPRGGVAALSLRGARTRARSVPGRGGRAAAGESQAQRGPRGAKGTVEVTPTAPLTGGRGWGGGAVREGAGRAEASGGSRSDLRHPEVDARKMGHGRWVCCSRIRESLI